LFEETGHGDGRSEMLGELRPQPAMQANREAFLPLAKLARASAMAASITP
jgi:hypothetical protein